MLDIERSERSKYRRMWDQPQYRIGSPGLRVVRDFLLDCKPMMGREVVTLVDLGCGTGRAGELLSRYPAIKVDLVDFAPNANETGKDVLDICLWDLQGFGSRHWDWGYCVDVLEHIPPEKVPATLDTISRVTDAVFFEIATVEDGCGDLIGEDLHLTVRPPDWWHTMARQYWPVVNCEELSKRRVRLLCKGNKHGG